MKTIASFAVVAAVIAGAFATSTVSGMSTANASSYPNCWTEWKNKRITPFLKTKVPVIVCGVR